MHIDIWVFWLIVIGVFAAGSSVGWIILGAFRESEQDYIEHLQYGLLDRDNQIEHREADIIKLTQRVVDAENALKEINLETQPEA